MPQLEPKVIQKELKEGWIWPCYWIYGTEALKSKELLKRIKAQVLGKKSSQSLFGGGLSTETLEGAEVNGAQIADSAQSLSLGGGIRFIVVRDAHLIKEPEALEILLGEKQKKEDLSSVCVFLSKDLDKRKKFTKTLIKKTAVIACEAIKDHERGAWIDFLAKRKKVKLDSSMKGLLTGLDPWSLELIEQELEKVSLAQHSGQDPSEVILGSLGGKGGTDLFLSSFFQRKQKPALEHLSHFSEEPEKAIPLLGLMNWNVRQLTLVVSDLQNQTRNAHLPPFLQKKMLLWAKHWSLEELTSLQKDLGKLDFETKQSPRIALGSWTSLINRNCRLFESTH